MKTVNKWLIILLALSMVATLSLVGCGNNGVSDPSGDNGEEKSLTLNARTEPPSLDSSLATDSTSFEILRVLMEGLVRLDENDKVVEGSGMAESWEISDDEITYTFSLKDGITWSNGDPVVAGDFEYAWKKVLAPETAADYAYQLFCLENGEAYSSGKANADKVGVKALDEKTLEVKLQAPTPYFLQLTAFGCYYPINQSVAEANSEWAGEASTYVGNGPFTLKSWEHDNEVVVEKNPNYWNKDAVKLSDITWIMVNDDNTAYQLYKNEEIDMDIAPHELTAELIESGDATSVPVLGTYIYIFNNEDEIFSNINIRKAFSYAIDREAIVNEVTKGGQLPATGFVPPGSSSDIGVEFREYNGNLIGSISEAKGYLEKGIAELGLDKLPTVTLSYNTNEGHQKIAEAVQAMWQENLGVNVELQNQEWKVYLETLSNGDFQIGRYGWLGDFMDPMTFLDMFVTNGGNNDSKYSSDIYDNGLATAKSTGDQQIRLEAMSKSEKALMEDAGTAPIYFYTKVLLQQDYVKGVVLHGDGALDYTWTYIE